MKNPITPTLGDRMKSYEKKETKRSFFKTLPIYARIDGRGFSRFTRGMNKPYDTRMADAMIAVARYIMTETHARVVYTQSDEINVLWQSEDYISDVFFAGKIQKMTSVLASMAAARMAAEIRDWEPYRDRLPAFDCRTLQLPDRYEAANMMLWRSIDAQKNAVQSAAQAHCGHAALQGAHRDRQIEMLAEKGVAFDDFPPEFRFGTFIRRARGLNANSVERSFLTGDSIKLQGMTNRVEYLFDQAIPRYE